MCYSWEQRVWTLFTAAVEEWVFFMQLMLFCVFLCIIPFDKDIFYTCLIFVEVFTTALFLTEGIWFLRPCYLICGVFVCTWGFLSFSSVKIMSSSSFWSSYYRQAI